MIVIEEEEEKAIIVECTGTLVKWNMLAMFLPDHALCGEAEKLDKLCLNCTQEPGYIDQSRQKEGPGNG